METDVSRAKVVIWRWFYAICRTIGIFNEFKGCGLIDPQGDLAKFCTRNSNSLGEFWAFKPTCGFVLEFKAKNVVVKIDGAVEVGANEPDMVHIVHLLG